MVIRKKFRARISNKGFLCTYTIAYILIILLKEFPTDDVCPQAVSKGEIFGTSSPLCTSYTVIFAGAHSGAKDAIFYLIKRGHHVLFISTTQVDNDLKQSLGSFPQLKLQIYDATRSCSQQIFKYVFQQHDVRFIHLIFNEHDFHEHKTSTETGKLLECLIKLLNVLSKQSKATLHLHLPVSTQIPQKGCQEEQWGNPSQEQLLQLKDDLHCKVKFNYKHNTDNFLKTVQIFVTTFKRMYHLSLTTVLS